MKLVSLDEYKNRAVVAALKELLKLAERGDCQGVVFVAKMGARDHRAGLAGDYQRCPEEALSATFQMERHLMGDRGGFKESR
jgi:hypothetical protein